MSKGGKIATSVILIIGFFIFAAILSEGGASGTFIGLIALGLFYGIRSMFKKEENETDSEIALDKKGTD